MFSLRTAMMSGVAACAVLAATPAFAEVQSFDIAAQSARTAIPEFGRQSGIQILASQRDVAGQTVPAIKGEYEPREALAMLLAATNLRIASDDGRTVTLVPAPQSGSAAGGGAEVEALIVTAQKREENIQDVPIAISAFTAEALEQQKIEGGFDLLKAIPNVTFSKNNFTSYNFSIRGIGTKAVSATTDPGVAVSFNNIALLQNRLFEQEYFDIERVEVLRGPQGTLYGRNATAGVINVISAKPDMDEFEGSIKGEVGNYHSKRASAMINIPLIEDKLAVRVAGAFTDRQGYDFNSITGNAVNGRDLWSARLTLAFNPTDRIRANLIWERFEEDDNRSRTGKQLCHRDPGPSIVGETSTASNFGGWELGPLRSALYSQGCLPGSLYDDGAFGTPNGLALPFVFAPLALQYGGQWPLGIDENGTLQGLLLLEDPYRGMMQSRDLRTIASFRDPRYEATADVVELNMDFDIGEGLTLFSQTAYNKDRVYSFQDFNRFNTGPVFQDTMQLGELQGEPSYFRNLAPGGYFNDPQLGKSNTLAGFDISQGEARQFTQELRLQSDFEGPLNFSVGANYTRFKVLVDYYVFYNLLTAAALMLPFNGGPGNAESDITKCGWAGYFLDPVATLDIEDPAGICPYIDPNPIESINGDGHNYFRSKNPYKLNSKAAFGELYWQAAENLKVTAGLRYTEDEKTFIPVPSQVLLARGGFAGGTVNKGYPERPPIEQHWGEWTGRLGVDWKPDLTFTDDTMIYGFYSRGYKGGGANPPSPGFATQEEQMQIGLEMGLDFTGAPQELIDLVFPTLRLHAVEYKPTFRPEFVNTFEIGTKNTLLDGALTLNTSAFYYDYTDYQVSQIRDRTAVNENFDATAWGLELEGRFAPSRNLQIIGNVGYLDTKIGDGMKSINIMDRTQGNDDWIIVKSWLQYPSNCIAHKDVAEVWLQQNSAFQSYWTLCGGIGGFLGLFSQTPIDPATEGPYTPAAYPEINGGAGFYEDVSGNELPNAPHWTANLGAQYGFDGPSGWRATVRGDVYWQSQSWARVYNDDPYDKLHGWYNANLSLWLEDGEGLKIEIYAKNLLDKTPITDAFLNSDDTALTTNVFVLDPRLIGLSIRKEF